MNSKKTRSLKGTNLKIKKKGKEPIKLLQYSSSSTHWNLCTNYNFRARESMPILRITGNDSVVSQACTPSRGAREFGRFVNFNRKRGFTSRRSRYTPLQSSPFRVVEFPLDSRALIHPPLLIILCNFWSRITPYVIIRRENFQTACTHVFLSLNIGIWISRYWKIVFLILTLFSRSFVQIVITVG